MLTAEKQVSQVLGCCITQARYSQLLLIFSATLLLSGTAPHLTHLLSLMLSRLILARTAVTFQFLFVNNLLDLKVSLCWVLGYTEPLSPSPNPVSVCLPLSLSLIFSKRIKMSSAFVRTVWEK